MTAGDAATCSACGAVAPPGAKFCAGCGARMGGFDPPPVERRAAMGVDVPPVTAKPRLRIDFDDDTAPAAAAPAPAPSYTPPPPAYTPPPTQVHAAPAPVPQPAPPAAAGASNAGLGWAIAGLVLSLAALVLANPFLAFMEVAEELVKLVPEGLPIQAGLLGLVASLAGAVVAGMGGGRWLIGPLLLVTCAILGAGVWWVAEFSDQGSACLDDLCDGMIGAVANIYLCFGLSAAGTVAAAIAVATARRA